MSEILEKTLEDIVKASPSLQNKAVWMDVAVALAKYEKDKMDELKQEVYESYQFKTNYEWNIHVMLLSSTETLPRNYEYISDEDEDTALCGYLDGNYEICKSLYQKEFNGHYTGDDGCIHQFTYQLVRSSNILDEEKRVCKFASFYHITVPLIYAPSLRRFVKIITSLEHSFTEREKKTIDLELSQDDVLAKCFQQNIRAIWNVNFSEYIPWDKKEIPIDVSRRTEHSYRHVCNLNTNEYLWFKAEPLSDYDINVKDGVVTVTTFGPVLEEPERMVIEEKNARFSLDYYFDHSRELPRRICTEADIIDVLGRFQFGFDKNYKLQFEFAAQSIPTDESIVFCEYERHYQYPVQYSFMETKNEGLVTTNSLRTIWLIFRNDNSPELYDRIVFVISWLRQQYPEFAWKGGYRR